MSSLILRIQNDIKQAMLEKSVLKLSTLRMLKSAIKHAEMENRQSKMTDDKTVIIIRKQVKQRQDSADEYKKAGRDELAQKELDEIIFLEHYLPKSLNDAEVELLIKKVLVDNQLDSNKDFGKAMKLIQEATQGRADNRLISEKLRKELS